MRIAIVDDDPFVRMGLRAIVLSEPGWEVVGEADDGRTAINVVSKSQPDVVLMDIRMRELDGLAATRELTRRHPHLRIVILTTFEVDEYVFEALRSGASGFLLKRIPPADIIHAVRAAASGESLLFPQSTRDVVERFAERSSRELPELTDREQEVLRALAQGESNSEIAARLFVSVETVKSHVAAILMKLGARDRTQAVIAAYESGFVRPGETGESSPA